MTTGASARRRWLRLPGFLGGTSELARCRAELARYREAFVEIQAVCAGAARGDLERRVMSVTSEDELGRLANTVNHLLDLTDAYVRESTAALVAARDGRFYRRFLTRGMLGSFGAGAYTINDASASMKEKTEAIGRSREQRLELASSFERTVLEVSESVAAAATQAAASAQALSDVATTALDRSAAAAASTDAVIHEMDAATTASATVAECVADIEAQVEVANRATHTAANGLEHASGSITGLADASRAIGDVVAMIRSISTQTKILGFNATIEAARAGEAGKGFAVVAGEVRTLADRTGEATEEISRQIDAIQNVTGAAGQAVKNLAETVQQASTRISSSVERQQAAKTQIESGVNRAGRSATDVASSVAAVRSAATETSAAAVQMQSTAEDLSHQADRLQQAMSDFLEIIRTGA